MWINQNGDLYNGDCALGDREATGEEVAAYTQRAERNRLDEIIVSTAQLRLALLELGMLEQVEAFVASSSAEIQLNWNHRTEFRRTHPLFVAAGTALGQSEEDLDNLLLLAQTK